MSGVDVGYALARSICRAVHPNSFIAGGYLRDVLLGIEPDDVDVYVPWDHLESHIHNQKDNPDSWTHNLVPTSEGYVGCAFRTFDYIPERLTRTHVRRVNIIALADTALFLRMEKGKEEAAIEQWVRDNFDIGLCMVAYQPTSDTYVVAPEFTKDVKQNTLTVYRKHESYTRHITKMMHKFPSYEVINLCEEEEYEELEF